MPGRSFAPITLDDLRHLGDLARQDREDLFTRHTHLRPYASHVVAVALGQGAALHFLDGRNGVKDWDVWTFYAALPGVPPFPPRRRKEVAFGRPGFEGSAGRVDLIGRSLPCEPNADPAAALAAYLRGGRTATSRFLAEKAMVLVEPVERLGEIVWPLEALRVMSDQQVLAVA